MHSNNQNRRHAGLWLDQRSATLITKEPGSAEGDYTIRETLQADGEQRGGNEHTMNSGKQADTLKYFKALTSLVSDYDEILIFGPGKLQEQFHNFLKEDTHFNDTKITLETAEHGTGPQMISQVREFFK